MTRLVAVIGLATCLLSTACKPTCQDTCRHFYADAPDGCGASPSGIPADEAISSCTEVCQNALQIPGEPVNPTDRRFDPERQALLSESNTLANEQEAAAWMDCVWTFSDEECPTRLDQQYCVKIF